MGWERREGGIMIMGGGKREEGGDGDGEREREGKNMGER